MFLYKNKARNGDCFCYISYFSCDRCGLKLCESSPIHIEGNKHFCGDCAFILNMIEEKELRHKFYFFLGCKCYFEIIKNKVVPFIGKRPKKHNDYRHRMIYKIWRDLVFKRDKYTCQDCGVVGGNLNAHHIKSFNKNRELRFDVDNGTTLCVPCHRKAHRKAGSE